MPARNSRSVTRNVARFPLSLLALAVSTATLGQDAADTKKDSKTLEEITVYATSNPLPVFDYPGQVSVVGREEIDLFMPSAVSDLMRDIPGVEFSGGPRRTGETPSIRGRGGENVLILFDGARQSFISAHDGRFFIEPELIGTAEVVRGPASALYGTGAVGGVLAFETVDASDLLIADEGFGMRIRGGYQDVNDETNGSITGYYKEGKLDMLASLSVRDSGDIELGSGDELASDDDILSGLLKAEYQLTEALQVSGSWLRFENDAVEPNNGQGINVGDPTLGTLVNKDVESDTFRLGLNYNPVDNDWINAKFTAYTSESQVEEAEIGTTRVTVRDIETDGISVRNASSFLIGDSTHTITVGGDWFEDQQVGRDNTNMAGIRNGVPDGKSEFLGAFVQLESSFTEPLGLPGELLLVPGIRYDDFESSSDTVEASDNSDDEVSLRLGVSYGPTEWFRVFANYAEGFRAPSINELYLDGTHFTIPHPILGPGAPIVNAFIPNPDLVPEDSETLEFGIGLDFNSVFTDGDRLAVKTSYYDSEVVDLIDLFVEFSFNPTCFGPPFFPCGAGVTSSRNVADAELEGYELEGTYDSSRFFARAAYGSIDGENKADGSDLGVLFPDRLNFDFRLKLPEFNSAVGTRIQFADEFERNAFNDDTGMNEVVESRDDYVVYDIYATWSPAFLKNVRIDASVENLADEDYDRVFQGVSEPGRNVKVAFTWQGDF
ncbi:MAG: TonB-dependent hemoglobin/transferrin/lactoferrin family receptor [Pseudomonadota bacterium]